VLGSLVCQAEKLGENRFQGYLGMRSEVGGFRVGDATRRGSYTIGKTCENDRAYSRRCGSPDPAPLHALREIPSPPSTSLHRRLNTTLQPPHLLVSLPKSPSIFGINWEKVHSMYHLQPRPSRGGCFRIFDSGGI
jgi:hypothetical protein